VPPQLEDLDLGIPDPDIWTGNMDGFDWRLEQARRTLEGSAGFSPFRMDYWRPPAVDSSEIGSVSQWDTAFILLMNVAQKLGWPSVDGAPVAKVGSYKGSFFNFLQKVASGRLEDLAGGPLFLMLEKYFITYGPVYKLAFGPRSFIVVSDPVMAKHVLKSNIGAYDKGVLANILVSGSTSSTYCMLCSEITVSASSSSKLACWHYGCCVL
jgi:hypothetical protein